MEVESPSSAVRPRTVMMFPGQGAQYYQMGRELYEADPAFRAAMDHCDEAAGPIGGRRLSRVIFERGMGESEAFTDQHESTAALFAVSYSLAMALHARGVRPDLLLGYSLGETIAATFAGQFALDDAFRMIADLARAVVAGLEEGAMVAVLDAHSALSDLPGLGELAALNAPRHFVVALPIPEAEALGRALDRRVVTWVRLPVRYPFHSALLEPIGPTYRRILERVPRRTLTQPLVSSATGAPIGDFDPAHAWQVARGPIRFAETIRALVKTGPCRFVEAGPSGTLASFVRQELGAGAVAVPAINQFGRDRQTMDSAARLLA